MKILHSKPLAFLVFLLTLQSSLCFLNQLSDTDIRSAIKSAVEDGLVTVDSFLRKKYWQFLQGSSMELYNVTILEHSLNFKIIYSLRSNIYRGNCNLDKLKWEPYLNTLVKLPTELASKLHEKNAYDLFLLNNEVKEIKLQPSLPEENNSGQATTTESSPLQNLTPIPKEPKQSSSSSGAVTVSKSSLSSQPSN